MSRKLLLLALGISFALTCGLPASRSINAQEASPFPQYEVSPQYKEVTSQSLYVTMRDGVKIAIDVVLPQDLPPDTKIPTIMNLTRYWRASQGQGVGSTLQFFASRGYAMVRVDVRGSGASFGRWSGPSSSDEVKDAGEIVNWIVAQHWSNGKVGAMGNSYEGSTAQMLAAVNHPAVKAVIPRFHEFDVYTDIAFPGGIFDEWFIRAWNEGNRQADQNTGVKAVDADSDRRLLREAIQSHAQNLDVYKAARGSIYRDDRSSEPMQPIDEYSIFSYRREIERSKTAIYGWGSWLDAATADTAIRRFLTFNNPQTVIIGPWSHGASYHASPYLPADAPVVPSRAEQMAESLRYFDHFLKGAGNGVTSEQIIIYYTLGEERWKTTKVWPVAGTSNERWYLTANGMLSQEAPKATSGVDKYTVDFEATTGQKNRWYTENGGGDVVYPDRADEDRRLLTYTSAPLSADTEITGYPVINLQIASTATDGAFFVYLEDVDETGRVTYVTEGQLRALHRNISTDAPPYKMLVPYHSFKKKDGLPLVPGEMTKISFGLQPTSVLIKKGHRIRIAIAGHDKDTFARIPADGTPVITVARNKLQASSIELPIIRKPSTYARATTAPPPNALKDAPRPANTKPVVQPPPEPEQVMADPSETFTTVDQILEKYVQAVGGKAALEKLTSRAMKGEYSVPGKGYKRPVEVYAKTPDKCVTIIHSDEKNPGYGFDGTVGWDFEYSGQGLRELSGGPLAALKREGDLNKELHLSVAYSKLTLKGKEKFANREAYVIDAMPAQGNLRKLYFDTRSLLLIRMDTMSANPEEQPLTETYYENYRMVDGVRLPFTIRNVSPRINSMNVYAFEEIKHNVSVDDAIFRKPGGQ
jgi:putative CocE/NonD family hydrolase